MRIALFSDIHGNRFALDAVIADARSFGVDAFGAVGDLAAIGPEPVVVLERLAQLDNLTVVRGNTDRYIVTGEGPSPTLEEAQADPGLVDLYARVTASFAWTRGFVTAAGVVRLAEEPSRRSDPSARRRQPTPPGARLPRQRPG